MNRILKILFLAIVFFMGYLWFGQIFKSCNKPKSDIGQLASEMDEKGNLPNDDFFEDDSLDEAIDYFEDEESSPASKTNGSEPIDYHKLDEIIDNKNQLAEPAVKEEPVVPEKTNPTTVKKETKTKPSSPAPTPSVSYDSGGNDFMVIAGSYLVETNANEMVETLKKMGFSGAEKVVFDLSKFYSVSAGRFADHESATKAASKLKSNGIDCYVHKKK